MKLAPVVMFVYNRADHFMQTVDALGHCIDAEKTDLYIFSDGPKNDEQIEKVKQVREVARQVQGSKRFQSVHVIESQTNRGLAQSVISGVTEIIEKYGKVIVIEDDCIASPHFLTFMNRCLEHYEDNKKVGAVAGFTPRLQFPKDYNEDIFFTYRSCSCGWATWRRCWEKIDWELEHINDFYQNPKLIYKLNLNGRDRFIRLYRQTKGNGSSWSVRFGAHLVKNDWVTLYPSYSYIQNIGCDESGVHSKTEDAVKMQVDLTKALDNPILSGVIIRDDIQRLMRKHYSSGLWSELKRFVATKLIVLKERGK